MSKTIMIVAGEASGDLHGSEIARQLYQANKDIRCIGMGSEKMRDAGVELLFNSSDIAVVGLWEVLTHWSDIKHAMRLLEKHLEENPPDLLLLIDYQEFNLRLAKIAKQLGVKVLFYVSPQLWAWRRGRIKKFAQRIDMMAVIFPFEVKYFEQANIPVRYVGHPLTNKVNATVAKSDFRHQIDLKSTAKVIGLLPGSRQSEIKRILPILLSSAAILASRLDKPEFLIPIANPSLRAEIQRMISASGVTVKLVENDMHNAVNCCDAVIVASGTATLEVALLGVPMAIVYRVAPFTYAILKHLIRIPNIGLANIVAEEQVAREFVQDNAIPEEIAAEIDKILSDKAYNHSIQMKLALVKQKLGSIDGIQGICQLVLDFVS